MPPLPVLAVLAVGDLVEPERVDPTPLHREHLRERVRRRFPRGRRAREIERMTRECFGAEERVLVESSVAAAR